MSHFVIMTEGLSKPMTEAQRAAVRETLAFNEKVARGDIRMPSFVMVSGNR